MAEPDRSRDPEVHPSRCAPARWLYVLLGLFCVGLGTAGVFLPLLPTTIFLIIAAWAFARSSPRLHAWLYNHPRFGPTLRNWYAHRVVSRKAKTAAVIAMAASLAITAWSTASPVVVAIVAVCLVAVGAYLITRPSAPPGEDRRADV